MSVPLGLYSNLTKYNFMKKCVLFFAFFVFFAIDSFSQKDFTFCYGSISVTMFGGGNAEMVRYNSSGSIVSRVTGTFDLYGKGSSTEVLKIQFQGKEYRYDLIRDGYGNPSKIFDNQGMEYNLCKTSKSSSNNFDFEANLKKLVKENAESDKSFNDQIKKLLLNYKKGMKPDDIIRAFHDFDDLSNPNRIDNLSISVKASYNELKKFYDKAVIEIKKRTIGKPITIDGLIVAQNDFPKGLNWSFADLGPDWRLPSKDELNLLYLNKKKIGGFSVDDYGYASSTTYERDRDKFWVQNFYNGKQDLKNYPIINRSIIFIMRYNNVRAVKTDPQIEIKKRIKDDSIEMARREEILKSIIGKPIQIGNIEVAQYDFPNNNNWDNAKKACKALGEGWRLPTIDELKLLYLNKNKILSFAGSAYWSSTEDDNSYALIQNFNNGNQNFGNKDERFYARAVKIASKEEIKENSIKIAPKEEIKKSINGNSIKIASKEVRRSPELKKDYANVFYNTNYTLFDLFSDEPIFPDKSGKYDIIISSNENKSPQKFTGTGLELSKLSMFKFKSLETHRKWAQGDIAPKTVN